MIEWQIRRISLTNYEVWSRAEKRGWVRRLDVFADSCVFDEEMDNYDEGRTRWIRVGNLGNVDVLMRVGSH